MRGHSAAPRLAPGATASSTALDTGSGKSGDATLARIGLAPHVLQLLEREGVRTPQDWKRLGKRRLLIFGIVPSVVRDLDRLARGAR